LKSLNLKATNVFEKNYNAKTKIVVNQGGTRSGKTYAILQLLLIQALEGNNKLFTVVRKSFPSLRISVLRDFINLLTEYGLYSENIHNKSEQVFTFGTNKIEFISLDQPQKKRGAKRHTLFINESNELSYEDYFQLIIRTTNRVYMDFNPSDEFHWIYDRVLTRDDCTFIQSTYKDNPFLEKTLIDEIERLKDTDENYWNIYGLGERGQSQALIFPNVKTIEKIPENAKHLVYGLDFGFAVSQSALIQIFKKDNNLYFNELIYERGLTNNDLCDKFLSLGIDRRAPIYGDSAEPKSIEEIYRLGWNIKPTSKGKDSVSMSIDILRRYTLHVTRKSHNLLKEFRTYKYEVDKEGIILNKPIKKDDHGLDAIRYGCLMVLAKPNFGKYYIN
jgi:phage terminase large subunit|tara:strand:+ start:1234 stop:2400 length:1167 start_codon:yes stop_codon:yes gene_type:complete